MAVKRTIPLLSLVSLLLACATASPASFECDRARTRVEKLICRNESLSALDSRLGHAYSLVIHDALPYQKTAVVVDQKGWLESVRDHCDDVACLAAAYQARLSVLSLIRTAKVSAVYVTDEQEQSTQTSAFQSSLQEIGLTGSLSCTVMVRLLIDQPTGRDPSYGALCELSSQKKMTLMLCNDTRVGKLTVAFDSPGEWRGRDAADFTANNCPPG
jgi:uncharacterized protein